MIATYCYHLWPDLRVDNCPPIFSKEQWTTHWLSYHANIVWREPYIHISYVCSIPAGDWTATKFGTNQSWEKDVDFFRSLDSTHQSTEIPRDTTEANCIARESFHSWLMEIGEFLCTLLGLLLSGGAYRMGFCAINKKHEFLKTTVVLRFSSHQCWSCFWISSMSMLFCK